jgi:hypothetical protein
MERDPEIEEYMTADEADITDSEYPTDDSAQTRDTESDEDSSSPDKGLPPFKRRRHLLRNLRTSP